MNDRQLIQRMSLFAYAYARMKSGGFQYIRCLYPEDLSEGDCDVCCIDGSGVACRLDPGIVHSVFVSGTGQAMSLLIIELEEVLMRGGSVFAKCREQGKMPMQLSLQDVGKLRGRSVFGRQKYFDCVFAEFKLGAANE